MLGPYELNTIVTGDARELAKAIPDESVDLIIADPPYGIGYASSRTTRMDGSQRATRSSFGEDVLDTTWVIDAARCLKPSGAMYLFTRWDVLRDWQQSIEDSNLVVKSRIVWNKSHWKMGDLAYYGNQLEDILFCIKGREHTLNWAKRSGNLWSSSSSAYLPEGQYDHPTQKPEYIIRKIIELSSNVGDTVADFHCGSGTTPKVARDLGRSYIAFEIDDYFADMARERVANTQPPLFVDVPQQLAFEVDS